MLSAASYTNVDPSDLEKRAIRAESDSFSFPPASASVRETTRGIDIFKKENLRHLFNPFFFSLFFLCFFFPLFFEWQGMSSILAEEAEDSTHGTSAPLKAEEKDQSYFAYYGLLAHQAQMLQDSVRTSSYQKAILTNAEQCFRGEQKVLKLCMGKSY